MKYPWCTHLNIRNDTLWYFSLKTIIAYLKFYTMCLYHFDLEQKKKKTTRASFIEFKMGAFWAFHAKFGESLLAATKFGQKELNWKNWQNLDSHLKCILIHILFWYYTISWNILKIVPKRKTVNKINGFWASPSPFSLDFAFVTGGWFGKGFKWLIYNMLWKKGHLSKKSSKIFN